MKKIILSILLLLTVSFLSWCSIDWNWEKDQKISNLEKQIEKSNKEKEKDLFKKRQECLKYNDEMIEQMYHKYWDENIFIEEIFYSPINNSCIYVSSTEIQPEPWVDVLQLNDFFTKKTILECLFSKCANSFNLKVKELKWE